MSHEAAVGTERRGRRTGACGRARNRLRVRDAVRRFAPPPLQRAFTKGRAVWDAVMGDDIGTSASAFAYHMIFAIPPLVILTVTIAALVTRLTSLNVTANLQRQIRDHAPQATRQLLTTVVDQALVRVSSGGASLGVAVTAALALWSGSNAVGSLLRAFNRAYGVAETRSFVQRARLRLILTLLTTIAINLAFVAVVFGHRIGRTVAAAFHLSARFNRAWNLLTWPTAIIVMTLLLAVLYYAGPNVDCSFRWISPGSLLATALWLGAVTLFGWWLNISNPGSAYGALGGVVVLLLFLDVTGFVFLLGAKLNAEIGKRFDPLTMEDLATTGKTKPSARLGPATVPALALERLRQTAEQRGCTVMRTGSPRTNAFRVANSRGEAPEGRCPRYGGRRRSRWWP